MKVIPGGCLKYLCAYYLQIVLFSLPLLGGFSRGVSVCALLDLVITYGGWRENNNSCVRELGIYQ